MHKKENKTLMFYINSIHEGGAERVIINIAHFFSQTGYRSILVTSFIDEQWEYPVPAGVERISIEQIERHESFLVRNLRRIYALRQLCKKHKPAVLISFMGEPNCRALLATIGLPVKNIISVRSNPDSEYRSLLQYFFTRYLFPRADGCVFQTTEAMRWFPESLQRKSAIILNPVQELFFQTSRARCKKDIIAIGRLEKVKNFVLLIDAFSRIADKYPRERLRIFGEGSMRAALQKHIEELHFSEKVILMGMTNNVPEVLSTARLFVLSSDSEGMPNALMEAMAMGVPVIATDCPCGGPRTLIEDGVNGRLVPVRDVGKMGKVMDALLADERAAEKMGRVAKTQALERFHFSQIMKKWQQYVSNVVKGY